MALTKKALNDHFLHSFGQVDEPVRSMTGNDGLIIGGICENAGTITAVEHGDFAALHLDNNQNVNVNLNTLISGEDQTNNLLRTEQRNNYYHYVGTVAGTVKTSAGFIHAITVNKAGTSDLTVYDSVGTSATVIGIISGSVEQTKIYDVSTTTGITVLGTSAIDVTISWR